MIKVFSKQWKKVSLVLLLVLMCLLSGSFMADRAEAATTVPSYIYAVYSGGTVLTGEDIDLDTLKVYAVYSDGSVDEVSGYTLSSYTVTSTGSNLITVVYLGKTAGFYVNGKKLSYITATYTGGFIYVGDSMDTRKLHVYMIYTDGSSQETKEYTITDPVISSAGLNQKQITYGSKNTSISVYGLAAKKVSQLIASYTGSGTMVGLEIDREDIYVTAVYSDGSSGLVSNYTLSISKPQVVGDNVITVTYSGVKTTVTVTGIEKTISSISAEYNGETVEVGGYVRLENITVTAKYADGSTEKVTGFTLPNPEIYYVGTHSKTVYYQELSDTITVIGVEEKEADYDNAATFEVSDGYIDLSGEIAVPAYSDAGEIYVDPVDADLLVRLMRRVAKGMLYISFQIDFSGEIEDEFPLEMTLEIPDGYSAENCILYYTPNQRSIIAQMNTEADTDRNALVCDIFNAGTYVLVYTEE